MTTEKEIRVNARVSVPTANFSTELGEGHTASGIIECKKSWFRFVVETVMRRMRTVTPRFSRWITVVLCCIKIIPP